MCQNEGMNALDDPVAANAADERETSLVAGLAGCARGETEALEQLYEALSPQLYGLLLRILQRRDLAEEALQDTFVNVWRKASEYRASRGRVTTWVSTIARYRAFDILRRNRREIPFDPQTLMALRDTGGVEQQDVGDLPHGLAEYRRLRQCLDALSEQQRSSVVMAYFRGLTQQEMARRFGAPLGLLPSSGEVSRKVTTDTLRTPVSARGLAVSVEPAGGSPTGQPTGPVVSTAAIARI